MNNFIHEYFITGGVYRLKNSTDEFIFVCSKTIDAIGKLVQYKYNNGLYEKTNISYFLNAYSEDDIKSLFLKRENYDMLGILDQNYIQSEDEQFVSLMR